MIEPDIRFTLANERTFLAWVRTAIGLIGAGVAVFHLLDQSAATTILSVVLLASGALTGLVGFVHFRAADLAIRAGERLPTNHVVFVLLTAAILLAAAAGAATMLV
ncbi:YidH family protein [Nocardioides currus]|uniref:DUF202 domain-containing protein n=1 Tax=Nocardioides currus TaxID=2133958 RepID=A0A2R7Z0Y7_9ACTN|nr:DUF202 domain-containing protein [Nocardioides currus]PUA82288.1 hypothetical protein C7S10_00560 [Nocardioides currus]